MAGAHPMHLQKFASWYFLSQEMHLKQDHNQHELYHKSQAELIQLHADMHALNPRTQGDTSRSGKKIALCERRLNRAIRLLTWVMDEADLSGEMELAAAIRAFLSHE